MVGLAVLFRLQASTRSADVSSSTCFMLVRSLLQMFHLRLHAASTRGVPSLTCGFSFSQLLLGFFQLLISTVEVILADMSFDDLESMGSGPSLPLQTSARLHELSMPSKSFSSEDAPHALKLGEMRLRCSAAAPGSVFCGCVVLSLSQCHTSPMLPPRSLRRPGFVVAGPPCSSATTSTMQVPSGAFIRIQHKRMVRLIDKT